MQSFREVLRIGLLAVGLDFAKGSRSSAWAAGDRQSSCSGRTVEGMENPPIFMENPPAFALPCGGWKKGKCSPPGHLRSIMGRMKAIRRRPEGFLGQRLVVLPGEMLVRAAGMPVVRDLEVTHLGHFTPAAGHYVRRPEGAAQWVLIFCLAGIGAVEWSGRRWQIKVGDLVLLPPGEAHLYEADLLAPWSIFWVHFTGVRADDFVKAVGWTREAPVLHVPAVETMMELFEDVYRNTLHGYSDADLLGLSTEFARFLGAVRLRARARDRRARRAEDRVLAVLRRLRESPERRWTVGEMARAAGFSITQFAKLFNQQTGSPPMTFLIRLRLQRACEILQQGDETIEEIAHRVGYEDAYYFSRLFRKHIGVAPSRFRAEVRGGRKAAPWDPPYPKEIRRASQAPDCA